MHHFINQLAHTCEKVLCILGQVQFPEFSLVSQKQVKIAVQSLIQLKGQILVEIGNTANGRLRANYMQYA
jgi:hypothetical protein